MSTKMVSLLMPSLWSSGSRIRSPIKVGAAPHRVVAEVLRILLTAKILQGILRGTLISTNIHANVFCTWITCLVPKNQPDQRRSHIGPNAGGSLNLSNWKSKLCIALHNAVKMFHLRGLSNQEHSKFSALEGTFLMSSNVWISGLSPPCTQRNCWFMRAARGRQSKASMHASYTRSVYLILPRGQIVNVWVAYDVEDWLRK